MHAFIRPLLHTPPQSVGRIHSTPWQNSKKMYGTQTVRVVTQLHLKVKRFTWEKQWVIVMLCITAGSVRRIQLHRCGWFADRHEVPTASIHSHKALGKQGHCLKSLKLLLKSYTSSWEMKMCEREVCAVNIVPQADFMKKQTRRAWVWFTELDLSNSWPKNVLTVPFSNFW